MGIIRLQYLQSLIYCNNGIGIKTMMKLVKLVPNMTELAIDNAYFVGGKDEDGTYYSSQDLINEIVRSTRGLRMMKLKISNHVLSTKTIFYNIFETLYYSKNLICLDLSWCRMFPKDMYDLSMALVNNSDSIRNLNLSYNILNFRKDI